MSVELLMDPDEDGEAEHGFDLCPNAAWRAFYRWVDAERFPALGSLSDDQRVTAAEIKPEVGPALEAASGNPAMTAVLERLDELTADMADDAVLMVE